MDARAIAGAEARAHVHHLVRKNLDEAAAFARKIEHGWYRCQSLAHVAAEVKTEAKAEKLLRESIAAAYDQTEPNRIVSVAAWPLSVMIQRGLGDVDAEVDKLLDVIAPEPNPVRRGTALLMVLEAVFPRADLRHRVLEPLLASLTSCRGWRARRYLGFTALVMSAESKDAAKNIVAMIPPSKEAKRAASMVQYGEWTGPHKFLPHYAKR